MDLFLCLPEEGRPYINYRCATRVQPNRIEPRIYPRFAFRKLRFVESAANWLLVAKLGKNLIRGIKKYFMDLF